MHEDDARPKIEALQETNNLLQAILNGASDGIYAKDLQGRYVIVNAAGASFVGSTVEQMVGKHFSTILPAAEASASSQEDSAVVSTGRSLVVETTGKLGSEERHFQTIKTLLRGPSGEPLYVIATVQDITARKQAEAEQGRLYAAEQEARSAAERGRQRAAFLGAVSTALASSLDYTTTLLRVARLSVNSFASLCTIDLLTDGRIRRTAFAAHDSELEPLLRELSEQYAIDPGGSHSIAQAIRSEKAIFVPVMPADYPERADGDARQLEILRQLPCGSSIVVPLAARGQRLGAISFVSGQPGRYSAADLALAGQIAYRASVAIDNAQLYQQSETAVRLRDQFLTIASHELKTPLTSLVGYAELLERRASEANNFDERDRRAIHIIAQQTARLEKMIDTMLDVSRIEHGRISIACEPLDLNTLATQVTGQMRLLLKRHVLDLRLADAPVEIDGDEMRLGQVLQNLIQNAIKYSPLGGTISVEVRRTPDQAQVSVSDQGIGIPAAALPHLFGRFYRAPNAEAWHISGMGIGLYIAQEIIRLHAGEIQVASEEGKGSTFTLSLPLAQTPIGTSGWAYASSLV
jgi:PAS domain S-box-containing protein